MKYYIVNNRDRFGHNKYVVRASGMLEPNFEYDKEMVFESEDMASKFCFLLNRIEGLEDKNRFGGSSFHNPRLRENY